MLANNQDSVQFNSSAMDEYVKQRCWTVLVTEYCASGYLLRIEVAAPMWLRLGQNCVACESIKKLYHQLVSREDNVWKKTAGLQIHRRVSVNVILHGRA